MCYQFIYSDTWEVGYQAKPLQKELLDRNPSAGPPSSVRSALIHGHGTLSMAMVSRAVPPEQHWQKAFFPYIFLDLHL